MSRSSNTSATAQSWVGPRVDRAWNSAASGDEGSAGAEIADPSGPVEPEALGMTADPSGPVEPEALGMTADPSDPGEPEALGGRYQSARTATPVAIAISCPTSTSPG